MKNCSIKQRIKDQQKKERESLQSWFTEFEQRLQDYNNPKTIERRNQIQSELELIGRMFNLK